MTVPLFDGGVIVSSSLQTDISLLEACDKASRERWETHLAKTGNNVSAFSDCLLNAVSSVEPSCDVSHLQAQVEQEPEDGLCAYDFKATFMFSSQRADPIFQLHCLVK